MKPLFAVFVLCYTCAAGAFEIIIDRGNDNVPQVGVVPFSTTAGIEDITPIIEFDLLRSGRFRPLNSESMLSFPSVPEQVNFRDWRVLDTDYVVIGTTGVRTDGRLNVTFHVFDVTLERRLFGGIVTGSRAQTRDIAHMVADLVFEAITGVRGAFSTKIMYVTVQNRATADVEYRLEIADSDGARIQSVLTLPYPVMSPTWSPSGTQIAYTSFETGRPTVFLHTLASGFRESIADFSGNNSAPAFSPDGAYLALALSRDGNSEIYTLDLSSRELRRITNHRAIDTEPTWSVDNESILFTSDRSGSPQVYQVKLRSLVTERMTFQGDYNARPRALPDRKHFLYVHRLERKYHVVWQTLSSSGDVYVLTKNVLDESPSVAPNGSMVIYATKETRTGQGILGVVSVDGNVSFKLPSSSGEVQEPAWSPYMSSTLEIREL